MWSDVDASATGIRGGAYIISPNQTIALPNTTCTYPPY